MAEIKLFLERMDVEDVVATNQIKVFRLKNALADDLQPVLQEAITGQAAAQGQGQQPKLATGPAPIVPKEVRVYRQDGVLSLPALLRFTPSLTEIILGEPFLGSGRQLRPPWRTLVTFTVPRPLRLQRSRRVRVRALCPAQYLQ